MFIKQVIIEGFKSYKEKTVIGPFDPAHNVVVGRNGSGKSNFFSAIEFVLSGEFSSLKTDQRQALLHEGVGPRSINGYVEIIFDNVDRRIPIDKNEISLKRSIGAKKDQLFLNAKLVANKAEVVSLLEMAGFSRSNPYYIVKQGQISALVTCTAKEKLQIVKGVAGTDIYDEKKERSKKEMAGSEVTLAKINEALRILNEKYLELDEEREMLEKYRSLDRQKRAIEFVILEKDIQVAKAKVAEVKASRNDLNEEFTSATEEYEQLKESVSMLKEEYELKRQEVLNHTGFKSNVEGEMEELLKEQSRLEMEKHDLSVETDGSFFKKDFDDIKTELQENNIAKRTLELRLQELKINSSAKQEDLDILEKNRNDIYSKQSRKVQFKCTEDRNTWINSELSKLAGHMESNHLQIDELQNDLQDKYQHRDRLEKEKSELEEEKGESEKAKSDTEKQLVKLKETTSLSKESNCALGKEITQLQEQESLTSDKINNIKNEMKFNPKLKAIMKGIESVKKVVQELQAEELENEIGYSGLVIDRFSCEENLYVAIDETIGNKLFWHIVDSDRTATLISKEIGKRNLPGEFTFIPLNRIAPKQRSVPENAMGKSFLLKKKLNYDETVEKAIQYVFGKVLICKNFSTVIEIARNSGLECVTLDGEKGSKGGVLSGGYINPAKSKIKKFVNLRDLEEKLLEIRDERENKEGEFQNVDMEIKKNNVKIQNLTNQIENMKNKVQDNLDADLRLKIQEFDSLLEQINQNGELLRNLKRRNILLLLEKTNFELEREQDMNSQLDDKDKSVIDTIVRDIEKTKEEYKVLLTNMRNVQIEINSRKNKSYILEKKKYNVEVEMANDKERSNKLKQSEDRLRNILEAVLKLKDRLKVEKEEEDKVNMETRSLKSNLNRQEKNKCEKFEKLEAAKREREKMFLAEEKLNETSKNYSKQISKIAALPRNELENYQAYDSRRELSKLLKAVNQKLKKYKDVNQKALDQHVRFSEEIKSLKNRREELISGKTKIQDLIASLDEKKNGQVLFTFKQMCKNFTDIFADLVPHGTGELVLTGVEDGDGSNQLADATGLEFQVSFTDRAKMKDLKALSGGQKSIVAMAFILSIQQLDPAPFYLFDEVDAALDVEHRRAISRMIYKQAGKAQFITTTFRPELLERASLHFGVTFRGKSSKVEIVSREEAKDFVDDSTINN